MIDIKFANRKTYFAFQEELIALVKNYYKSKLDDMNILDDMLNQRIQVSEKVVKEKDSFLVDKTPNLKTTESTPQYRKSFGKSILTDEKIVDSKNGSSQSRGSCFNCDKTNHSLRDCPEPRNMKKINKARNEFGKNSNVRYHEDADNDRAVVPGKISDDLRAALGIHSNQIPVHVYKMRQFGYPPGWFEEAKVHNSGLSLFIEKDKKQVHPGADSNDFKYNIQKFYDFPGFNVKPDPPFHDQHHLYHVPPMQAQQSKEAMIEALGNDVVNGYKRTKLQDSGAIDTSGDFTNDKTALEASDMEIEDPSSQTLPLGVTVYLPPPVPSESTSKPPEPMEEGELDNDESGSESPDESELTEKRKALLAEIAESSVFLDTSSINTTLNNTNASTVSLNQSQFTDTINENSENENRDNTSREAAPEANRAGFVDSTIEGCPLLPSFSPFNALPAGEKFQEGVSDVIAFENLAESTGKYEKMKTLIKKIRHQKDNST